MTRRVQTTDNNYGLRTVVVDGVRGCGIGADILNALTPYSGIALSELAKENNDLFVFPRVVGANEDDIGSNCLFSLPGGELTTHNIAGVIGINHGVDSVSLSIRSRFDRDERHQYFLNSMLKRVLGINLLNLDVLSGGERIWDLYPYLFPLCLNEALVQGLYRTYRQFALNDGNLRGSIDIARHIQENMPFHGSVAYEVREHTENNAVMQLVRHTIEYIASNRDLALMLNSDETIRRNVMIVRSATPDYNRQMRREVVMKNMRFIRHPYYTKWSDLQRLCVRILCHDKLSFNGEGEKLHGVVFDVAWLWEEYLSRELVQHGFIHSENKTGRNPMALYQDGRHSVYPDFRSEARGVILDAKYKRLDRGEVAREDLYQMVTYIHTMPNAVGRSAILLYPRELEQSVECKVETVGNLAGYGGKVMKLAFNVPQSREGESFCSYEKRMKESMKRFVDAIRAA